MMRSPGQQALLDRMLARYLKDHPHAHVMYVVANEAMVQDARQRLMALGLFCVGDLALAPNGAQVQFHISSGAQSDVHPATHLPDDTPTALTDEDMKALNDAQWNFVKRWAEQRKRRPPTD